MAWIWFIVIGLLAGFLAGLRRQGARFRAFRKPNCRGHWSTAGRIYFRPAGHCGNRPDRRPDLCVCRSCRAVAAAPVCCWKEINIKNLCKKSLASSLWPSV